jgi:membrane-associated phospholipid phosphatase
VFKVLWAAYPPVVAFVVIVTANHWWIDGVIGVLVAALSACAAYAALARARPDAWSWRTAPARIPA